MLEAMANCGRWLKIVAVRFSDIEPGLRILEKMLSISVLKLLLFLTGCKNMCGKNIWEEKEPRDLLVRAWW